MSPDFFQTPSALTVYNRDTYNFLYCSAMNDLSDPRLKKAKVGTYPDFLKQKIFNELITLGTRCLIPGIKFSHRVHGKQANVRSTSNSCDIFMSFLTLCLSCAIIFNKCVFRREIIKCLILQAIGSEFNFQSIYLYRPFTAFIYNFHLGEYGCYYQWVFFCYFNFNIVSATTTTKITLISLMTECGRN